MTIPTAAGHQVGISHVSDDESGIRQPCGVPPAVLACFYKRVRVRSSPEFAARKEADKTNKAIVKDSLGPLPATHDSSPSRGVDQEA